MRTYEILFRDSDQPPIRIEADTYVADADHIRFRRHRADEATVPVDAVLMVRKVWQ